MLFRSHGQGELIEVNDTNELARKFVKLILEIVKGSPIPTTCQSGVTSFSVDPGIDEAVVLIPTLDWKITLPSKKLISSSNLPTGWSETRPLGKFTRLNVTMSPDLVGKWSINSANLGDCPSVFLDSGLRPKLDSGQSLTIGLDGQELRGKILNKSGNTADLSVYDEVSLQIDSIDLSSLNRKKSTVAVEVDKKTATWKGNVTPFNGSNQASLLFHLVVKTKSGTTLPEVRQSASLPLIDSDQLCSLATDKVAFSPLFFNKKPASGEILVNGPKSGSCELKLKTIKITQDVSGRTTDMFEVSVLEEKSKKKLSSGDVVTVPQGDQAIIKIDFNDKKEAVKGQTKGLVVLSARSSTMSQDIDLVSNFDFESKKADAPIWFVFLLTTLGLGASLALLQWSNYMFGRFKLSDSRIANIPVSARITESLIDISRLDSKDKLVEFEDFHYLGANVGSERNFTIGDEVNPLLTLKAKLPKNPFGEVMGRGKFEQGRVGFSSEDVGGNFNGKNTSAPLNPSGYWAVSIDPTSIKSMNEGSVANGLISIVMTIDESSMATQFGQVKNEIVGANTDWKKLIEIGQALPEVEDSPSREAKTAKVQISPIQQGFSKTNDEWGDSSNQPANPITENSPKKEVQNRGFFGRQKSKKTELTGKNEVQNFPQERPAEDDPWA